jgi:HSP20 family protein
MAIKDLIPWKRTEKALERRDENELPLLQLRHEMDRLFDTVLGGRPFSDGFGSGGFRPEVEVKETSKEVRVSAELPGLDEKDIHVSVADGMLVIEGHKQEEHEEEKGSYYHSERTYGAFRRSIPLPAEVDADHASATFKKGVLKISLPKDPKAEARRRKIEVQ